MQRSSSRALLRQRGLGLLLVAARRARARPPLGVAPRGRGARDGDAWRRRGARTRRARGGRQQERTRRVLSKRPPSHTQTGPFRRAVVLFRLKSLSTNSEVHSNVASIACILFRHPSRRLEKVKRSAKKSTKKSAGKSENS